MPGQDDLWAWLQSMGGSPQQAASSNMFRGGGYGGGQSSINANAQAQPQSPALGSSVSVAAYPPLHDAITATLAALDAQNAQNAQNGSAGDDGGFNNPYQAAAADAAHAPPSAPFVQPQHPSTMRYPMWPTPPAPQGTPSATPQPADSGPKGPLASPGATATPMKRRAGAPNLGYYAPNDRFSTFKYETPNSSASRAPIYTAMNLFGGGQPAAPAANPNVPAAAAQPVSSPMSGITPAAGDAPLPATADANAPWWMGPLQFGNIWKGSGGPHR